MSKEMFFREREHLIDELIIEADREEQQLKWLDEFAAPEPTGILIWSSKKRRNRFKIFKERDDYESNALPF